MNVRNLYERFYQWLPLIGGLFCIGILPVLSASPGAVELVYRNGLFRLFRWLIDSTSALLPIPGMLVILFLFIVWLVIRWYRRSLFHYRPWYRGLLNAFGIAIMWFYLSWGFNYAGPGLADKLELRNEKLSKEDAKELLKVTLQQAGTLREMSDTSLFFTQEVRSAELHAIHAEVREHLQSAGFLTPGMAKMRLVSPSGWMRRIGVSGIYMPFSGECHADASYPALQLWYIVAHEYAHAYGVTDEGECNLVAFMALQKSQLPHLAYSAWLDLAMSFPSDSATYSGFESVLADRRHLRAMAKDYPPILPGLARHSNNLYLKANGVDEGIGSYAKTPTLVWELFRKGELEGLN